MPTRYVVLENVAADDLEPGDTIYRLVGVQEGRDLADAAEALDDSRVESGVTTYAGAPAGNWHEADVEREVVVNRSSKRRRPSWLADDPEAPPEGNGSDDPPEGGTEAPSGPEADSGLDDPPSFAVGQEDAGLGDSAALAER